MNKYLSQLRADTAVTQRFGDFRKWQVPRASANVVGTVSKRSAKGGGRVIRPQNWQVYGSF